MVQRAWAACINRFAALPPATDRPRSDRIQHPCAIYGGVNRSVANSTDAHCVTKRQGRVIPNNHYLPNCAAAICWGR